MGNIGRPSTGCGLCRKRRVKCDEGRPNCRNCTRLKKPCPGYRDPNFGRPRQTASEDAHSAPQSTFSSSSSSLDIPCFAIEDSENELQQWYYAASTSSSTSSSNSELSLLHVPGNLCPTQESVTEQAVWYSLNQLHANGMVYNNEAFSFLPTILAEAGPDSFLYAAMRSVGAINLANRSPGVDMQAIVDCEYENAVSKVTAALADPDQYLRDETLVAIWLLSQRDLYEGVKGYSRINGRMPSSYLTHYEGMLMLLRLRGEKQFQTPRGRHLFQLFLSSMNWKPLFSCEEPSKEYLELEAQLPKATMMVPTASVRLREYFHGVCKLRARINNFLLLQNDSCVDPYHLVGLYLRAASRLDAKIQDWCDQPRWMPKCFKPDPTVQQSIKSPWTTGSTFRRLYFECWAGFFHWNRYFVARILLHMSLLDAIASVYQPDWPSSPNSDCANLDEIIAHHSNIVHDMLRHFLGTFAYAFGDIDESGHARTELTPAVSDGASCSRRPINVPGSLQIHPPLSYLISSGYLTGEERAAMYVALRRHGAEFQLC